MSGVLLRIRNILVKPRDEWQVIKEEETTYGNLVTGYCALISAVPPIAAVMERFIFNRGIVSNAVHSPLGYVIAANLLWYLVIMANVIITGAVITAIVSRKEPGWVGLPGLQLASYSYTPLFLVGILIIVPRLAWLIYPAILYSLYLLALGIRIMTGLPQRKAAVYAVASFIISGVIVGVLNGMEYMLESFLANRVFF
jgi:Yip1 domain